MKRVLCTLLALTLCLTSAFTLILNTSAYTMTAEDRPHSGSGYGIYFMPSIGEDGKVTPEAYLNLCERNTEHYGFKAGMKAIKSIKWDDRFANTTFGTSTDGFLTLKPDEAGKEFFGIEIALGTGIMPNSRAKYVTVCYRVIGETFTAEQDKAIQMDANAWGGEDIAVLPFKNADDSWVVTTTAERTLGGNWWYDNNNVTILFPGLTKADAYVVIDYIAFCETEADVAAMKTEHDTWLETLKHFVPAPVVDVASDTYYEEKTVTITAEDGVEIRYTLDGSEPTAGSKLYTAPLTISETTTLKAIGIKDGNKSAVVSREYTILSNTCKDPVIELPGLWVPAGTKCTIIDETEGAVIHYTLDGSDPTADSPIYSEPFVVDGKVTIKAIAMKEGFTSSKISKVEVKKQGKDMYYWVFSNIEKRPDVAYKGTGFDLLDGYNIGNDTDGSLKLPFNEEGAGEILSWYESYQNQDQHPNTAYPYVKICYKSTADVDFMLHFDWFNNHLVEGKENNDPSSFSHSALEKTATYKTVILNMADLSPIWKYQWDGVASTLIRVQATNATAEDYFNLKYIAFLPSEEAAEAFDMVSVPAFSVVGGFYNEKQTLEFTCATEGAKIYYTTDGSEPSATNGTLYTGAIELTSNMTVKAIAVKDGMLSSAVSAATYEISLKAKTPEVDLPAGKYDTEKTVTISCATPGAKIYYTTDGSNPSTTNGKLYEGPITLKESCILRVIAIAEGMDPSTIKSVNYKFDISAEANTTGGNNGNNGAETTAAPEKPEEAGCASVIGMSALIPALLVLGGAMIIKKKKTDF